MIHKIIKIKNLAWFRSSYLRMHCEGVWKVGNLVQCSRKYLHLHLHHFQWSRRHQNDLLEEVIARWTLGMDAEAFDRARTHSAFKKHALDYNASIRSDFTSLISSATETKVLVLANETGKRKASSVRLVKDAGWSGWLLDRTIWKYQGRKNEKLNKITPSEKFKISGRNWSEK